MVTLDQLAERSDFVSLNCDLNPTSHHLIGTEFLRRMKPTGVLVNTARGPVVDEAALVESLGSGESSAPPWTSSRSSPSRPIARCAGWSR